MDYLFVTFFVNCTCYIVVAVYVKRTATYVTVLLAGETRFEHATSGFGDRCSTIEPLP